MEKPVIYYVDAEMKLLEAILQELSRRYSADYKVLGDLSPASHCPGSAVGIFPELHHFGDNNSTALCNSSSDSVAGSSLNSICGETPRS